MASGASHYIWREIHGMHIGLDTLVTPELEREGLARDIIRHIQAARKSAALEMDAAIGVDYWTEDDVLRSAITEHGGRICAETRCRSLRAGSGPEGGRIALSRGRAIWLAIAEAE